MSGKHILVVEDKYEHRHFICEVLRSEGHIVSQASNCDEAQVQLNTILFDIIFIDQMMPQKKGTEFWKEVKERFPGIQSKPVFLTAYPEDPSMMDIKTENIPVLQKPLQHYQDILDAIRNL